MPFGVHGSWSSKYVAGPPKEAEIKAIAAAKAVMAAGGGPVLATMAPKGAAAATQSVQEGVGAGTIAGGVAAIVGGVALIANLL